MSRVLIKMPLRGVSVNPQEKVQKMVKKWFEVDMNNSKNQSFYGKQMKEDLKKIFKCYEENRGGAIEPEPEPNNFIENFEIWCIKNTYTNLLGEDFEEVNWNEQT